MCASHSLYNTADITSNERPQASSVWPAVHSSDFQAGYNGTPHCCFALHRLTRKTTHGDNGADQSKHLPPRFYSLSVSRPSMFMTIYRTAPFPTPLFRAPVSSTSRSRRPNGKQATKFSGFVRARLHASYNGLRSSRGWPGERTKPRCKHNSRYSGENFVCWREKRWATWTLRGRMLRLWG